MDELFKEWKSACDEVEERERDRDNARRRRERAVDAIAKAIVAKEAVLGEKYLIWVDNELMEVSIRVREKRK